MFKKELCSLFNVFDEFSLIYLCLLYLDTASHLPYNRNGFKFFTNSGGLGKADIKNILERAEAIYDKFTIENLKESAKAASIAMQRVDYMAVYTSDLAQAVRKAAGNVGTFFSLIIPSTLCKLDISPYGL